MSLLNGLAAAAGSISNLAGAMSMESMRSSLEQERMELANKYATERESLGRKESAGYAMDAQRAKQDFDRPLQDAQTKSLTTSAGVAEAKEARLKAGIAAAEGGTGGTPGDSYAKRVSQFESGGDKMVPNALGSGAYGPYQFMPGTWQDVRSKNADLNLPADMRQATQDQHKAALDRFTAGNADALKKAGIEPTAANLYLAHRFGTAGAEKVIKADENAPLGSVLPSEWQQQNPDMRGQTVGGFKRLAEERMKGVTIEGGGTTAGMDMPADLQRSYSALVKAGELEKAAELAARWTVEQNKRSMPTAGEQARARMGHELPKEVQVFEWLRGQTPESQKQFLDMINEKKGVDVKLDNGQIIVTTKDGKQVGTATPISGYQYQMNNEQARDAGFADRMTVSNRLLSDLDKQGADVWNRFLDIAGNKSNFAKSEEYQQFQQAKLDFINAQLRRESGAVISKDEIEKADQQYFPQVGDTPRVMEQKARNRQMALDAMVRGAGPGYTPGPNVALTEKEGDTSGFGAKGGPQGPASSPREATRQTGPIDQAREAIARGAPRAAVIERLRQNGIDPSGL